jgi:hypothetical protein
MQPHSSSPPLATASLHPPKRKPLPSAIPLVFPRPRESNPRRTARSARLEPRAPGQAQASPRKRTESVVHPGVVRRLSTLRPQLEAQSRWWGERCLRVGEGNTRIRDLRLRMCKLVIILGKRGAGSRPSFVLLRCFRQLLVK